MAEPGRTPRRRAPVPPPAPTDSSRELKKQRSTSDSQATAVACSHAAAAPPLSSARTKSLSHVTSGTPPPTVPRLPPPRLPSSTHTATSSTSSSRHTSRQSAESEESDGLPGCEESDYANIDDFYNPYEFPPAFDETAATDPTENDANDVDENRSEISDGCTEDCEYENISTVYRPYEFPPSLVDSCLIDDPTPNRTVLNAILLSTGEPGAYFVRNSRGVNQKVLAFLSKTGNVNEYRILESDGKMFLDLEASFDTLEELLSHYTRDTLALQKDEFLGRGIHLVVDVEKAKLEKETSSSYA